MFKPEAQFGTLWTAAVVVTYNDTNHIDILVAYDIVSFVNQMTYSTGSYPSSAAVGDFNNGRKLDFGVVNNDTDSLKIVLQTC